MLENWLIFFMAMTVFTSLLCIVETLICKVPILNRLVDSIIESCTLGCNEDDDDYYDDEEEEE